MSKSRIYTAFDQIHADEAIKNKTSNFLSEQIRIRSKSRTIMMRRFAAAAASFVLLLAGGGYFTCLMPVSAISVDINPSLQLELNRLDQVVSVTGFNEDGEQLADSLDIMFLGYQDALDTILEDEQIEQYLTGGDSVYITVSGNNQTHCQNLLTAIEDSTAETGNIYCTSATSEEAAAAREAGLTVGKYRAFLELQQLTPDISPEDISGWTMKQIRDQIEQLEIGSTFEFNDEEENPGAGHQYGQNKGNGGQQKGKKQNG